MEELARTITGLRLIKLSDGIIDAVDILLVAFLIYRLLMLARGRGAWRIVIGIAIFIFLWSASDKLHLAALHWLLDKAMLGGPVALVILFLPELRQTIEGLGKLDRWTSNLGASEKPRAEAQTVEEIVAAVAEMAAGRVGALIAVEREASLGDFASNGVVLNARISTPLLVTIFYEENPLHDGAVIIRGDTIVSAACRLPLSESTRLSSQVHMRHRAGVGITEVSDCFCIIVSEERGSISVASDGRLFSMQSHSELREFLNKQLRNDKKTEEKPKKPRERKSAKVQVEARR
ncbi:MAG TPA: diadenylate cyclase CdaA [Fimbriimonas sp.]|nr:diadenylate cyclase CdaA [Fimbriimonas sp.]